MKLPEKKKTLAVVIFSVLAVYFVQKIHTRHQDNNALAYVDVQRVLMESTILTQEKAQREVIKKRLENDMKNLENAYANMPEPLRRENRFVDMTNLNNQFRNETNHLRMKSMSVINEAIENYRLKNKLSLVVYNQNITENNKYRDISPMIIREVNKSKINYDPQHTALQN
ncbi:TPA: hypothetical protein QCI71_003570 [Enterobacter chuandaensis]|uniref:hypothetical protein n=1 Tax=Enterobacter TaxID=547 RepID=UPI002A805D41|nr:hypothetical protein [Enterobacter sp. 118C5]HDR2622654.1 hypothetical protein [Enterobacter chuandaensis]